MDSSNSRIRAVKPLIVEASKIPRAVYHASKRCRRCGDKLMLSPGDSTRGMYRFECVKRGCGYSLQSAVVDCPQAKIGLINR